MTNETTPIPSNIRREIERRLSALAEAEDIRILLAVESGSRAWGFPSPDSDYDVRFVYLRRRDAYLSLKPVRDVIERPIVDEIDLNGWDITKTLHLLLASNAVLSEWMQSPIRYIPDHPVMEKLAVLADTVLNAKALAHHYARLGQRAADRWLGSEGDVPVKRYFYALRPAIVILCLEQNPAMRPPMNLHELMALCEMDKALIADIDELVELKSRTNEKSNGVRKPALDRFIAEQLEKPHGSPAPVKQERHLDAANQLFLELVNQ
ncbi:nucleotidyltransferase domain-containing protein [Sphingorhabdus arenilitoris]|uniref:Nucleotidyltransferase domain-containing protein n=1 Tax=Sphingorhabdus arenilitoris TaxID=1490041 RepID=A0ABV8RH80_9SPHN